jgi:hypothetical protein
MEVIPETRPMHTIKYLPRTSKQLGSWLLFNTQWSNFSYIKFDFREMVRLSVLN